jgi:hypothetical protein
MEVLLQALKIIFEVLRKKSNKKITRRKKKIPTYKALFFLSRLLFEPLLFSNIITFFKKFISNYLKWYRSAA